MGIVRHIIDAAKGKHPINVARSDKWPAVRKAHLEKNPTCSVCGGTDNLEVHHLSPFALNPTLELEPTNLITLCEAKKDGVNCHLFVGHLGNFKSFNVNAVKDASYWHDKITNRPKGDEK